MGLFINLYVNFEGIEQEQWKNAYEESKILLAAFPIDLMRYKPEEKYGVKRGVFTTDLIANKGKDDEFWRLDGDLFSGKRAETFILYKNECGRERRGKLEKRDVLWVDEDSLQYRDGNGYDIFGGKTQGYPYHLAVLAVGILFESRFPGNVFVTGDIDEWQVEVVLKWIEQRKILSRPVTKPVCMDGVHLWKRLEALYPDPGQCIERFKSMFSGSDNDELEIILKYGDGDAVRENFFNRLNEFQAFSQLGAARLIKQWLNVTHDLKTLIQYSAVERKVEQKEDEYRLGALLKAVCRTFVGIPLEDRDPLYLFRMQRESLHTIGEVFAQTFMLMGGARDDVNFYMNPAEIFDVFCEFEPDGEKQTELKNIMEKSGTENREYLDMLKSQIKEVEEKIKDMQKETGAYKEEEAAPPPAAGGTGEEEDMDQVIIAAAREQRKGIKNPGDIARALGAGLRGFIERNKDALKRYLESDDREFLLEEIAAKSFKTGIALYEGAWKDIDNEKRIPILKALLCLILIDNDEYNFWHLRLYLLEHKSLWKYLAYEEPEKEIESEPPPDALE